MTGETIEQRADRIRQERAHHHYPARKVDGSYIDLQFTCEDGDHTPGQCPEGAPALCTSLHGDLVEHALNALAEAWLAFESVDFPERSPQSPIRYAYEFTTRWVTKEATSEERERLGLK